MSHGPLKHHEHIHLVKVHNQGLILPKYTTKTHFSHETLPTHAHMYGQGLYPQSMTILGRHDHINLVKTHSEDPHPLQHTSKVCHSHKCMAMFHTMGQQVSQTPPT